MNNSFYFLHHGQTDWNDQGLLMGQQDIPLNAQGRQEAIEAGKILAGLPIATLCHSPLARARETAQIVVNQCPCSLFPLDDIRERSWGALEGKLIMDGELSVAEENIPPGAESKEVFEKRVLQGMEKAIQHPEPILFVSHDGVFEIMCKKLGLETPVLSNTRVAHFFQQLGKWCVEIIEH